MHLNSQMFAGDYYYYCLPNEVTKPFAVMCKLFQGSKIGVESQIIMRTQVIIDHQ
jgi:hypothetical protein